MKALTLAVAGAFALMSASAANAYILTYSARLTPAAGSASRAVGSLSARLETSRHLLHYRVNYTGLAQPPIAAAFHGPAAGAISVPIQRGGSIHGSVHLTKAEISGLRQGKWSFDLRTGAPPGARLSGTLERSQGLE